MRRLNWPEGNVLRIAQSPKRRVKLAYWPSRRAVPFCHWERPRKR